jgi:hypothetical protein
VVIWYIFAALVEKSGKSFSTGEIFCESLLERRQALLHNLFC